MTKDKSIAQRKSELKYRKKAVKNVKVAFFPKDYDVFDWIGSHGVSRTQFVKDLIQNEIDKEPNG